MFFFSTPKSTEQKLRQADDSEPWCRHKMPNKLYVDIKDGTKHIHMLQVLLNSHKTPTTVPTTVPSLAFVTLWSSLSWSLSHYDGGAAA